MNNNPAGLHDRFEFRNIRQDEADQAAELEVICFPPNEVCEEKYMFERIREVPDLFLVAADRETGKIAGFLTGIAVDEQDFRDEFFTDAKLHDPDGETVMLLGLNVHPEYRGQGLAREIVSEYSRREKAKGRKRLVLTCSEEKIGMYSRMGFRDMGKSGSEWGGEMWYEMEKRL